MQHDSLPIYSKEQKITTVVALSQPPDVHDNSADLLPEDFEFKTAWMVGTPRMNTKSAFQGQASPR